MENKLLNTNIERIKEIISEKCILTSKKHLLINPNGTKTDWLVNVKNAYLDPEALNLITNVFWKIFEKEYPFQVGGLELSSIPLIGAIVYKSHQMGKPINGFIIRKSRKYHGLQNLIEGNINEQKIILVDDIINSGKTLLYQIKALEALGKKVDFFFVPVNFREKETYDKLSNSGIKLISLFTLKDFGLAMGYTREEPEQEGFDIVWRFDCPEPNYSAILPKSTPVLDEDKLYFGSDNGYFWALNQNDGSVAWKFKVGKIPFRRGIFSSPALYENLVFFGSYDGNVYALDKNSGQLKWKNLDADYVGSSPVLAPELKMLFIGLEYGLFNKKGGIASLDLKTGKRLWHYETDDFVHCTPVYNREKKLVAVGSNNAYIYLFDARNGKLKWKFKTGGPIKSAPIFDTKNNLLLFGSFDKNMYALDIDSGEIKGKFQTEDIICTIPKVYNNNVYLASADKTLYSINLKTGDLNWKFESTGRFFSSPEIIEGILYLGSNNGKMYEIDINTGKCLSYFQTTERITNRITYNQKTKRFFIMTFANEVYCITKN